ncbi:hypothetical protein QR680_005460 [Steinernema hermaphroditum]|uniref:Uncharacterized protein n=1 Tax=Steinernema hermaphroditum TaxID=289476 RepID=A0AA39HUG4_9BILA|nr:hypothetical protein QR680_005460 [Steinernema hermaphroditum]
MNMSIYHFSAFLLVLYWTFADVFRSFLDSLEILHPLKVLEESTLRTLRTRFSSLMALMSAVFIVSGVLSYKESTILVLTSSVQGSDADGTNNATVPDFGNSFTGVSLLYPLDIAVHFLAIVISSAALAISYLMNEAVRLEYSRFNDELKIALEENSLIQNPKFITELGVQQMTLASVIRGVNGHNAWMASICFSRASPINVFVFFVFSNFRTTMSWLHTSVWGSWGLISMVLTVLPVNLRPPERRRGDQTTSSLRQVHLDQWRRDGTALCLRSPFIFS